MTVAFHFFVHPGNLMGQIIVVGIETRLALASRAILTG